MVCVSKKRRPDPGIFVGGGFNLCARMQIHPLPLPEAIGSNEKGLYSQAGAHS